MFPKMADQIHKTKSKAQVLQLKLPRLYLKTFMIGLCVLVASICSVMTATCPSSVPSFAATTTDECTFDCILTISKLTLFFSKSCVASQDFQLHIHLDIL